MKRFVYPVCFYKESDGQYSVIIPDFGGATAGIDLENALYMAEDCIGGMLVSMQDDGEKIPEPSRIEDIKADEYSNGFTSLVSVDPIEYRKKIENKTVKKNLTIPQWLNTLAENNHINFSKVLQDALKDKLHV